MEKEAPTSLVLYIPPEGCMDTLSSSKVGWVAPHMLKDPFENSIRTTLGFDRSQLEREMIAKITSMIFAFDDPSGEGKNTPIQKAIRRWRNEDRFHTEDEVGAALVDVVPGLVGQHYEKIINYMGRWQAFSTEVRLIRAFETPDSVGNWAEFAGAHAGIAIKLRVGKGHMMVDPKPVAYRQSRCFVTALKDQVSIILGDVSESRETHFFDQLLVKPRYLSAQKEWRTFFLPDHFQMSGGDEEDGAYNEYTYPYSEHPTINEHAITHKAFDPSEVLAVYLGAGVSKMLSEEVVQVCRSKYPQAKLFRGHPKESEYELEFKRI